MGLIYDNDLCDFLRYEPCDVDLFVGDSGATLSLSQLLDGDYRILAWKALYVY